jgi:hypothetical protein
MDGQGGGEVQGVTDTPKNLINCTLYSTYFCYLLSCHVITGTLFREGWKLGTLYVFVEVANGGSGFAPGTAIKSPKSSSSSGLAGAIKLGAGSRPS